MVPSLARDSLCREEEKSARHTRKGGGKNIAGEFKVEGHREIKA